MTTTANCKAIVDLLKQDKYIDGMIDIKIDSKMPVSALYALETIFFLRLQLAQVSGEADEVFYEDLCRDRCRLISKALTEKFRNSKSVNEKIEILERIEVISLNIDNEHSLFALEEASMIEDEPGLTYAQRLRLKWLPGIIPGVESKIVAELLPQTASSFELATLALISDFCTDEERAAIFGRFLELFDAALSVNDTAELGSLLALAACWNSNPAVRQRLSEIVAKAVEAAKTTEVVTVAANQVANQAVSLEGLSLPEKRVNAIAAAIYAQIDTITGKYADVEDIPA